MKLLPNAGSERRRLILMIGALVIIAAAYYLWGGSPKVDYPLLTGPPAAAAPVARPPRAGAVTGRPAAAPVDTSKPQPLKLAEMEQVPNEPNAGRNLFRFGVKPPPPPPPYVAPPPPLPTPTPGPPPIPPIPLKLATIIADPYTPGAKPGLSDRQDRGDVRSPRRPDRRRSVQVVESGHHVGRDVVPGRNRTAYDRIRWRLGQPRTVAPYATQAKMMMSTRASRLRWGAIGLAALMLAGCATSSAARRGAAAAKRGEWDAAVAYYREALQRDAKRVDLQIALERATRESSNQHVARAKELEAQDQLAGAAEEYRRAVEFDPSNSLALARAMTVEGRLRDLAEAARPPTRMETMRQQAAATSPIPRLDPRTPLPGLRFPNATVRDVLNTIGTATGISVQYDQGLDATLSTAISVDLTGHTLESAFNMVLSQKTLTFKILDSHTIFIYQDNAQMRAKYEDQYQQTFYLSHAEVGDVAALLNQMLTTTTAGNRPIVTQNKSAHAIVVRATAPMLGMIKNLIDTQDKPRAEVLIDVTILEVSRTRLKDLGIDLSSYSIGLTFSPGGPPTATGAIPPITAGNLSGSPSKNSFYVTLPSAIINFLESDQKTKLLAKPQLRGREGAQLTLNLGDSIPVPQTSFLATATGGVPTQPQVSYAYQPVGVNLAITPTVTYQDEIILDPITVDKSGLGPNMDVAGQSLPTFTKRTASTSMRLRDGESNLLAGLIKQEDREIGKSFPGINRIPILRALFGNVNGSNDQSDIIMIVTPHIIRSREITADDLKPFYVGTANNLGAATGPALISQATPPAVATAGGQGAAQAGQAAANVPPPTPTPTPPPTRIVAVEPAGAAPPPAGAAAQLLLTVPTADLQMGGAPYTVPVSIAGVSQLGAATLTITYDPKVLKATSVSPGTFMQQGNVTPTFVPKIDDAAGRIDIAISRSGTAPGAAGSGPLAGLSFQAVGPGTSKITITATAFTPEGKPIVVQLPAAASVTVK